jgi:predicted amidohydrolase
MHYFKDLHSYRWLSIGLCLMILLVAVGGSLGIVWMRTQMTGTAKHVAQMERDLRALENDNATLSARMARAHNPEFLIAHMPAGLRPTSGNQIVWIQTSAAPSYVAQARQSQPAQLAAAGTGTASVSFDLALMNQPRDPQP